MEGTENGEFRKGNALPVLHLKQEYLFGDFGRVVLKQLQFLVREAWSRGFYGDRQQMLASTEVVLHILADKRKRGRHIRPPFVLTNVGGRAFQGGRRQLCGELSE